MLPWGSEGNQGLRVLSCHTAYMSTLTCESFLPQHGWTWGQKGMVIVDQHVSKDWLNWNRHWGSHPLSL